VPCVDKEKYRIYQAEYRKRAAIEIRHTKARARHKQREWWDYFKKSLKCKICSEDHPATLDFHHVDPREKKFNIGKMLYGFSKDNILKEISKCIVLCSNCHRKLHYNE